LLQQLGEPEHPGRLGQRAPALGGEGHPGDHVPHDGVVHSLDRNGCDRMLPAREKKLAIVGAERTVGDHGYTRQPGAQVGQLGQNRPAGRQHDRVHQPAVQHPAKRRWSATAHHSGAPAREGSTKRQQRGPTFDQSGDGGHFSRRDDGTAERR
jgi:hypothetical protein